MGDKSHIEWTDASWNPVTGCSKVSPGCAHCYAEALSLRRGWSAQPWTPAHAAENVVLHPERLDLPRHWRKPRRIFVNSMSDLFHEQVPTEFIDKVFGIMALTPQHTYQVLTKRPERMREYLTDRYQERRADGSIGWRGREELIWDAAWEFADADDGQYWTADGTLRCRTPERWPLPNVWLGTSVENQHWADVRIPLLLETPAAVRFLSCEPLLGPVDLESFLWEEAGPAWAGKNRAEPGIDWVIVGGESGPGARPMQLDWVRSLRDQCQAADVAFFYKQAGGTRPGTRRILDGRTWDEFPVVTR